MFRNSPFRTRLVVVCATAALVWCVVSGIAATRGPDRDTIASGQLLFEHRWQPHDPLAGKGDGLGPVFNANSCVECHFQGGVGGAGSNKHNVLAFEVHPTSRSVSVQGGVVHAASVFPDLLESRSNVSLLYPVEENGLRVTTGCSTRFRDFDPVRYTSVNTPSLFGAGQIDNISGGAVLRNMRLRRLGMISDEFNLNFHSTPIGRPRILPDGRIGKFGWKNQFATVEEFVAAACAVEVGLSNPLRRQDQPQQHVEDADADYDLNADQFDALVAFVGDLSRPQQIVPLNAAAATEVRRGEALFLSVGCADCHTPNLGGVEGIYSDLLLHVVESGSTKDGLYTTTEPVVPLPEDYPRPAEWKTPPLWGVADTAPYFHDGASPTLEVAILRHAVQAGHVTKKYKELKPSDRKDLIAFLRSLRAPQTESTQLAAR